MLHLTSLYKVLNKLYFLSGSVGRKENTVSLTQPFGTQLGWHLIQQVQAVPLAFNKQLGADVNVVSGEGAEMVGFFPANGND